MFAADHYPLTSRPAPISEDHNGGESDRGSDDSQDLSDCYDIGWMYIPLDSWVNAYDELYIGHG